MMYSVFPPKCKTWEICKEFRLQFKW